MRLETRAALIYGQSPVVQFAPHQAKAALPGLPAETPPAQEAASHTGAAGNGHAQDSTFNAEVTASPSGERAHHDA